MGKGSAKGKGERRSGDCVYQPLLFRGGVGVVAMRYASLAPATKMVQRNTNWNRKGYSRTGETTPTPPLKRRG